MATTYDFSAAFASSFSSIGGAQEDMTLLALLKLHLGIVPGDTTNDEELTRSLNMAGDVIETYLDRVIAKREVLERWPHHFGTVILHQPQVDPDADVTVYLNKVIQSGYSIFLMRDNLAYLSRQGYRPDMPMDWRGFDNVSVTYTAGYDPLPSDLADAIVYTAAAYYGAIGTGQFPGGSTGGSGELKSLTLYDVGSVSYDVASSSGGTGGGSVSGSGYISDAVAEMLQPYMRLYT